MFAVIESSGGEIQQVVIFETKPKAKKLLAAFSKQNAAVLDGDRAYDMGGYLAKIVKATKGK